MKIVFLEAMTLGDVDLSPLKELGELTVYQTNTESQTIERIKDADVIIVNKTPIGKKELSAAPKLKLICVAATGYNNIDIPATFKHNVVATNVKGYSTESVAQHVFAHLLSVVNSVIPFQKDIRSGKWQQSPIFTMLTHPIEELNGKTLGIIGYGAIGRRVAELARVFGMKVLVAKRPGVEYNDDFRVSMETVITQSDVLTIHTPLTAETRDLITMRELKIMKPTAILINVARGGIVNEMDLYHALKQKIISFAIVDVLGKEPPRQGHPFFELDNILLTPHIAWTSRQAREKLLDGIVNNIRLFMEGRIDEIRLTK